MCLFFFQLNFVLGQLFAVILAFYFRKLLPPLSYGSTSYFKNIKNYHEYRSQQRHFFCLFSGLLLTYFCFGKQMLIAISIGAACYLILLWASPSLLPKLTLLICMALLSIAHTYKLLQQQGEFVVDITGTLMIVVQRATSIAYAIKDGAQQAKLSNMQLKYAVKEKPSLVEYFGYLFSFQSILAGPFLMFKDYQQYIEGTDQFAEVIAKQIALKHQNELKHSNIGNGTSKAVKGLCVNQILIS